MLRVLKIFVCLAVIAFSIQNTVKAQNLKAAIRLTESEQFDAAHKAFDNLITQDPLNGEVYYYYGESWLTEYFADSAFLSLAEATKSAMEYFKLGMEKVPGDPLNFIGAGKVEILRGKITEADAYIQKAKDLMPLQGMNYKKSDVPQVKQALSYAKIAEALSHAPGKTKNELLEIIDNAVDRDANVPEVYLIKGDICLNYNDGSSAMVAYNKAIYLDPKSSKTLVKTGMLNVRGQSYEDALKNFEDAISYDETFAPAYRERADLYGLGGQWENGLKDYDKFLELSGNNFYAKVRYASFLYMAKKYEDCIKVIEELKSINTEAINKNYNFLNRLEAFSYYNMDNAQSAHEAIKTFFKHQSADKIISDDYTYYGDINSKLGKHQEAVEEYRKALKVDTSLVDLYSKIAKEYTVEKKYEEAVKAFEEKISKGKATLTDYYDLGKLYLNLKEYDKADTAFGTLLAEKPDYINAVLYRAQGRSIVDSTSEFGLAKPWYEKLVSLSLQDSAKFSKYITISYDYLRYYYFKQYLLNKKCEDAKNSILYCDKMLAIDEEDEKSLTIKKSLAGKCP